MKKLVIIITTLSLLLFGLILTAGATENGRNELVHMRNTFTKIFKNEDNTITRQYWMNPIHYLNEDYQWEEIDRTIVDLGKDLKAKTKFEKDFATQIKDLVKDERAEAKDFNKGMTNHLFNIYFPKKLNHSIIFKYQDYTMSMKPLNILHTNKQKEEIKAKNKQDEITYTDVWYKTDLKYEITYTGFREYIILNDIDAERNFSFFIQAKNFELQTMPTGEIGAYSKKNGELIFVIPRPIMWDADNVYSSDVKYELKNEKNGYIMTLVYDQSFVNAPSRVFPVTIDPDITLALNYVDEMTFIDTAKPNNNFFTSSRMEVGNYKDWNFLWLGYSWEARRSLLRFNRLTADLGPVSDQVQVRQAKLFLTCSENKTESTFVDVYRINYDAPDWEVTRVTWNSPWGNGGSSVMAPTEDTWVYVVKGESTPRTYATYLRPSTVQTWIRSGETLNKGLMLYDYYEGNKTSTLKVFNNAALEITLTESIFIDVNATVYPHTPQTIQFIANASSVVSGTNVTYEWDFDINDDINNRDTQRNPIYSYQTPGEHVYSVKVTDTSGNSRTYYGTVYVPAVDISVYYGVNDPTVLRFVTNTNYNNTYIWEFGDGTTYVGVEGYHRYNSQGTYDVKLTISNNFGVNPLVLHKTLKYYQPTILVHGFGDDFSCWDGQDEHLRQIVFNGDMFMKNTGAGDNLTGLPVHTVFNFDYYRRTASSPAFENVGNIGSNGVLLSTTSGNGSYGNQYNSLNYSYAGQLAELVENIVASTGFNKVNIVAHSMGGLVSRSYIHYYGGNNRVDRLLTIGTPNHGIGDLERFVAKIIAKRSWQRELEVREMGYRSDTFYRTSNPNQLLSFTELLNSNGQVSINGENITGNNGNNTVGPTRYATIAGRDNGHINFPVVDLIWEWLAPDDGVIESASVALSGINVDANLHYPGIHSPAVPGNKSDIQVISKTPFVASYVNAWMYQKRTVNGVATKPAAWVEIDRFPNGTVRKFVVHTGATKENSIWTWAMLQHQEDIRKENGVDYYFSFKDYNSFWKDLTNATTSEEVIIDLLPAHYLPGDVLRITVVTYDTNGWKVEYIPVQL